MHHTLDLCMRETVVIYRHPVSFRYRLHGSRIGQEIDAFLDSVMDIEFPDEVNDFTGIQAFLGTTIEKQSLCVSRKRDGGHILTSIQQEFTRLYRR